MLKQEPIGLLIAIVRRRVKQVVNGVAQPYGLSPQQFWMIVGLAKHDGVALFQVAERLRMDYPTASRIITALTRRRLVRIATDPQDRRRALLYLTPHGQSLATELRPLADSLRAAMVAGLSARERETVRNAMKKIVANMDRFELRNHS